MLFDILLVVGGLIALLFGGEALVRGAVALARRAGLSPFVIGITLVGFGTSAPELTTSLTAALNGASGIALGNVVGSNIANVFLILGCTAFVAPIAAKAFLGRDGYVMLAATLMCVGFMFSGMVNFAAGLGFVTVLVIYLTVTVMGGGEADLDTSTPPSPVWQGIMYFLIGLVGILIGADWLVTGASDIARIFNVSDAVIGLTIVAVGTSLPELVTSVLAARNGEGGLAVGNVIGSSIFNILAILGITAMVQPLAVPPEIVGISIWVFVGAALVPMILAWLYGVLTKRHGAAFIAVYLGYTAVLVIGAL